MVDCHEYVAFAEVHTVTADTFRCAIHDGLVAAGVRREIVIEDHDLSPEGGRAITMASKWDLYGAD